MGAVWATAAAAPTADSEGVVGDMKWGMEREKQRLRERERMTEGEGRREEGRDREGSFLFSCSCSGRGSIPPTYPRLFYDPVS